MRSLRRASSRRPEPYAVLPYQDRYVLREARRLCPAVIPVDANHRLYTDYHERILAAVDTCLPVVKVMSIDENGGLGST
jgi:impB/mucB/samB family